MLSFLYSRLVLVHSLRFAKPSPIIPIIFQTMSQTERYMPRTVGRVERRDAPAPYTPTKPAPKPVCHAFTHSSSPIYAYDSHQEKKSSSIWDFIKSWSFFASSKDTASEGPEPTSEPSSPTNAPQSLQDIITRRRTTSPNSRETQEAIVALQAKATKNLYERGLEVSVQSLAYH